MILYKKNENEENNNSIISNQSYNNSNKIFLSNLIKINKGKKASVYLTIKNISNSDEKIFSGIIESAGFDYIILSNPENGNWYLFPILNVNYIIFDEEINETN